MLKLKISNLIKNVVFKFCFVLEPVATRYHEP
jgi:hypothetical protein